MAEWKKVIVSGSQAELAGITGSALTDDRLVFAQNGGALSTDANLIYDGSTLDLTNLTAISGSTFSGSFVGNGSGLTGLVSTLNIDADSGGPSTVDLLTQTLDIEGTTNEVVTSVSGQTITVGLPDDVTIGGNLTVTAGITASSLPAGVDNTVVILATDGQLQTDEIDSRVWGSTLVDNGGVSLTADRVVLASDGDSLKDDAQLTFDTATNILTIDTSTFGTDVNVAGDLVVQGTASFANTENLLVADRFVLFASGSTTAGDGGIVVQQGTQDVGELFGFENTATRWGFTSSFDASNSAFTPDAYVAAVVDIDGGQTDVARYQKNGNIKVDSGEIYIYA